MAEPTDIIVPLLREMRAENVPIEVQLDRVLHELDTRLGVVKARQKVARNIRTADALLGRLVAREFGQRIEALEKKVEELELHK